MIEGKIQAHKGKKRSFGHERHWIKGPENGLAVGLVGEQSDLLRDRLGRRPQILVSTLSASSWVTRARRPPCQGITVLVNLMAD